MTQTETLKYQSVSIDTMNEQINLRLPEKMLASARSYADKNGFGNVQELLKELLRERLFEEPGITKKELSLVKQLKAVAEKNNLYGTEAQLFRKLQRK